MFKTIFKIAIGVAVAAAVAEKVVDAYKEVIEEKDENDTIFDVIKNVAMKGAHNMNMEARDTVTWAKSEIRDTCDHVKNEIKEFETNHYKEAAIILFSVGAAFVVRGVDLIVNHAKMKNQMETVYTMDGEFSVEENCNNCE